jgi:hypothetical protein
MPGAPFAWTKAGLELEIGFGDSSIWRRLFRRQVSHLRSPRQISDRLHRHF